MKEVLLNPGIIGLMGTLLISGAALVKWLYSTKLGLKSKEDEKEEQKERVLVWTTEAYHRLRSHCGNQHGWDDLTEDTFPLFPPDHIIKGKNE